MRRRLGSAAIVALIHVLAIWAIGTHLLPIMRSGSPHEIQMVLSGPASTPQMTSTVPAPPKLTSPQVADVEAPVISVDESASPAADSDGIGMLFPPRPDVSKLHDMPRLPARLAARSDIVPPVLRILIGVDGTVGRASVVKSSGLPQLDAVAVSFVEANWHYKPAERAGRPVEDWITVVVHFAGQVVATAG